ncbi:MAG: hypothetical protein LBM08_05075, partial [Dysgonamonadaceae bacterium]|nr:hypothetical protein [Dysgonamonadaceae bacterium]
GHIANDPRLAVRYFLNALEKIPSLIEKYERENEKISSDLPVLQEIVRSTWRRENELKDLKTELAALDRKIQLSLKPLDTGEDKNEDSSQKKNMYGEKIHGSVSDSAGKQAQERLQTVGSISKYNTENQSKRFKL